jgi:hypothetical protein
LSGIAKALASIGKGGKNSKGQDDETTYGGVTQFGKSSNDDSWDKDRSDYGILDNMPSDI